MTTDASSIASPDYEQVLTQATIAYRQVSDRPAPKTVVEALLQAEKAAKQQRLTYPLEALLGQWQLCFTTGTRKQRRGGIALGRGFYLPRWTPAGIELTVPADASPGQAAIRNQIRVGAVQLQFTGGAKYLGKKNLLAFDFTQVQVQVFDRLVYTGGFRGGQAKAERFATEPIAHLPFFAFFAATEDWIAARGRGGGLALWLRQEPPG